MILKNGEEKLLSELSRKERSQILENLRIRISNYFSSSPEKLSALSTIIK